jgi:hypothetical protein
MHFLSKDLAKYAGYKGVEAFQVDQRRYDWPLLPLKRIQGRNRYAFTEAILAHVIWSLRALGLNGAAVGSMLGRIDIEAFRDSLDKFEVGLTDEAILTIPLAEYFDPFGEMATVHNNLRSAHTTMEQLDCVFLRLTDFARTILKGEM